MHMRLEYTSLHLCASFSRRRNEAFIERTSLLEAWSGPSQKLGRRPLRQSPYRVNCDTTSKGAARIEQA